MEQELSRYQGLSGRDETTEQTWPIHSGKKLRKRLRGCSQVKRILRDSASGINEQDGDGVRRTNVMDHGHPAAYASGLTLGASGNSSAKRAAIRYMGPLDVTHFVKTYTTLRQLFEIMLV